MDCRHMRIQIPCACLEIVSDTDSLDDMPSLHITFIACNLHFPRVILVTK